MAKQGGGADRDAQLAARMQRLGIRESDLVERFIKGSGSGGQKINKTSSCVYLVHEPSGIEVKCQRERSQAMNRYLARVELCDTLEERLQREARERRGAIEKQRRQKRKRSKAQKERMLRDKLHRGRTKATRRRVSDD